MNVYDISKLAEACVMAQQKYQEMRSSGAERWELDAHVPEMDDNHFVFTEEIRKLNLDDPASFLLFCTNVNVALNEGIKK